MKPQGDPSVAIVNRDINPSEQLIAAYPGLVSLLRNQGYASRVVSMRVSEQDVQDASRQVDAARSEAVAASTERSAVLSEAFTKGLAKLKSSRSSTGSTSSSFEQLGQTLNRLDQITRSVADSTGMSQSQVARRRALCRHQSC